MKNKKNQELVEFEIGSKNVFNDLGFENAEEDLVKADLVIEIAKIIKNRHLTQAQAAKIIGVEQPRVSSLLSGYLDLFSIEMLMHFLVMLGRDIEIVVRPKRSRQRAHASVCILSRKVKAHQERQLLKRQVMEHK